MKLRLSTPNIKKNHNKMVAESGKKSSAVRGYSVCPWRAEAQVPDWVCRASWRQLSQPDLPSLHLFPLWPKRAGTLCRDLWAVLDLAVSPLGCFGCVRSLSPAAPGRLLPGWSGSVSGRSGAATPRTSSFLLETVWARDPGQRNLGWWGFWPSTVEREQPHHLPQFRSTTEPIEQSLLYALLYPCPPCLFLTEPCQWYVSKCLTKTLLKKDTA